MSNANTHNNNYNDTGPSVTAVSTNVTAVDRRQNDEMSKTATRRTVDELHTDFSWPAVKHYCQTRVTELYPSKDMIRANRDLLNPIPGLKLIDKRQWLLILSGFWCWTWVAYDFFTISLNTTVLADYFDKKLKSVTWGITVVLMLRTVGSIIFGYCGDKYGRKWPLVINSLLCCFLEIGTGFVHNFKQFLAVRALFGILLGGIYGNAAATALDDCPKEARGIISGFLQQGYTFGYLLAVIFSRAFMDVNVAAWRAMFWFGAGMNLLVAIFRAILPETKGFLKKQNEERYNAEHGIETMSFLEKAKIALKSYWLMIIYMVFMMAGFNFMSHGSQDLYPTLLVVRYGFSSDASTVTNSVANLGALVGGIIIAHLSNFAGRRLTIICCCIMGGALIYPWAFVHTSAINAGAFFLQFAVQGAWGVVPVHLSELAPPTFRSFVVGVAYQLGNLAASASSTIESELGTHFPMTTSSGEHIYDYAKVMAIFVGAVFAYLLLITFMGPERRNYSFAMVQDAGGDKESVEKPVDEEENIGLDSSDTTVEPNNH